MTTVTITTEPAKRYVAPRLPRVGDRVHERGVFPRDGKVLAILEPYENLKVIVVHHKRKRRDSWECYTSIDWECGWLRPGRAPKVRA